MFNTQIAYRNLKSQTILMRIANEINRIIDFRRSKKLNFAQQIEIDRYSNVKFLRRKVKSLLQIFQDQKRFIVNVKKTFLYDYYRQVYQAHRNLKRRHEKTFLMKVKKKYKKKQSIIDIQRQLKKLSMTKQKAFQTVEYVFEKRIYVIDALFTFVTSSIEKKCQRRITTINALIALCKKQKNQDFRRRKTNIKFKKKQISILSLSNLSKTFSIECKATQCIFCLKNENLSVFDRLKTFANRDDFKKHFHRKHFRYHFNDQSIVCFHFRCDVILNDAMHLQNHVEMMHKTRI